MLLLQKVQLLYELSDFIISITSILQRSFSTDFMNKIIAYLNIKPTKDYLCVKK